MNEAMKDFSYNPTAIDIPRSKIKMRHSHKTTFDTGRLIPIYWREVIPGSTVKMEMAEVTRMQTPIFPIMDNAFIDTFFFFVPNRLLWDHWEEFMGENKSGYWEQQTVYEVPQIEFCNTMTATSTSGTYWKGTNYYPYGAQAGSLADYLGIPIVDANKTVPITKGKFQVNALPFRAYYQVYNDWFRDENLMLPLEFDKGDTTIVANFTSSDLEEQWPVSQPPLVAKFHDYFTSALPQPQKHDPVTLSLFDPSAVVRLNFADPSNQFGTSAIDSSFNGHEVGIYKNNNGTNLYDAETGTTSTASHSFGFAVDMSGARGISINEMRQAFAVQRYYEKQARGGKICCLLYKKIAEKNWKAKL